MTAVVQVVDGRKVYLGGVDLSGDENEVEMTLGIDEKVDTVFTSGSHIFCPGLQKVTLSQKGFVTYGTGLVDEALVARLGAAGVPVSVTQKKGLEGEVAYFLKAWGVNYSQQMKVGELPSFDFGMTTDSGTVVRGTILMGKSVLAAGQTVGTVFNLGTVPDGKKVCGALHIFSVGNGSVDVILESDSQVEFPDPDTVFAFAHATVQGSEFQSASGPFTDIFWRVKATVVGTATLFVVIGIA